MKYIKIIAGMLLAIAICTTTAQAEGIKPYVGIGVGMFTTDYGSIAGTTATAKTPYSMGGFLKAGADFHEYIGAELRVGAVSSSGVEVSGTKVPGISSKVDWFISYLLKPQFQFSKEARVYGLIGATTAKVTLGVAGSGSASDTKTQVTFGGGFEYEFMDGISAGVEYVQYSNKADIASEKVKIAGISALVNMKF